MPPRQVFNFADWNRNHPGEPLPGDRLDSQFYEFLRAYQELGARLDTILRDDGKLKADLAKDLSQQVVLSIRAAVDDSLQRALTSQRLVETYSRNAVQSRDEAQRLARAAQASLGKITDLLAEAKALLAQVRVQQVQVEAAATAVVGVPVLGPNAGSPYALYDGTPVAQDYAQVSIDWAEHMPDPIPPNTLAVMGISGNHWSSRWWAAQAASVVGNIPIYYTGAGTVPPTQTINGLPITTGSLWFDTSIPPGQMKIWNGQAWVPSGGQPVVASTMSLAYVATEGQSAFNITAPDVNGQSSSLTTGSGVAAYVNGAKIVFAQDYTVNIGLNTVTLNAPVHVGDLVAFDILLPPSQLSPQQLVIIKKCKPITPDGVTTVFTLQAVDNSAPAAHAAPELIVSVDGVLQEPSVEYLASGATITFTTAPAVDAKVFITWFGANAAVGLETDGNN